MGIVKLNKQRRIPMLEWLLSPITDKNTFTGSVIDKSIRSSEERGRSESIYRTTELKLKEREVAALEKLASQGEKPTE